MKRLKKPRFLFAYPLVIWLFLSGSTSELSLQLGGLLILLGEGLRLWANGYVGHVKVNWTQKWRGDARIGRLITAGPYAHVRHPLYVGTWLIGMGFCVALQNAMVAIGGVILFVVFYGDKVWSEEMMILDECGKEYGAYRAAVPRWFPTLRPYTNRQGRWSWRGVQASREVKTLLWVLAGWIALYFREEWLQEHGLFTHKEWLKHMVLLALFFALIATDGIMEWIRRSKRKLPLPRTSVSS